MNSFSFRRGARQIPPRDRDKFIKAVMKIFNVTTPVSYYRYERGEREPKVSQAKALEKLFNEKYQITDIWGKR